MRAAEEDNDLRWFFTQGQSAFEKSAFGHMLERQLNYTVGEDGQRIPHPAEHADIVWAHRQRGCRIQARIIDQELADAMREPWAREIYDPDPALTAQHSHKPQPTMPHMPDDLDLLKWARVSGALSRIAISHMEVLEIWYGNRGAYWSGRGGKLIGLLPRTKHGKRLLQQNTERLGDQRADELLAQQIREQSGTFPDHKRGALIAAAETEGLQLIADALRAYRRVLG